MLRTVALLLLLSVAGFALADEKPAVDRAVAHLEASAKAAEPGTWRLTGAMATPRINHTATLLQDGKVLVQGRDEGTIGNVARVELYDPATETWSAVASSGTPYLYFTSTLLLDGDVLTIGRRVGGYFVQRYHPGTGTWSAATLPNQRRYGQGAVRLQSGQVLIAGGTSSAGALLAGSELYDPISSGWTVSGTLMVARSAPMMTLLADGRVLACGGFIPSGNGIQSLNSAELYDPATGTWTSTGSMNRARYDGRPVLLRNGKVLIVGGYPGSDRAELYDPATGVWTPTGVVGMADQVGSGTTATVLTNGEVLVAGGGLVWDAWADSSPSADTRLYDPDTNLWRNGIALNVSRFGHTATLLLDGRVLVTGGASSGQGGDAAVIGTAELYTPAVGIDSGFTGVWYDPAQSGHGIFIEVLPDKRLLAWWFTFDPQGTEQAWFGGVGIYSGDTATITDVKRTAGGRWIPSFDSSQVVNQDWGTLTFTFSDRNHGRVDFDSLLGYGSGSMTLQRLTQPIFPGGTGNSNAPAATSSSAIGPGHTGTWYDPSQGGHGLFVEVLPGDRLLAWWFTFDASGRQAWFGGVGSYSGTTATVHDVRQAVGGRWIPNFDEAEVVIQPWGSFSFEFTDCNHGRVDFASVLGYGSGSMELTRLTQPAGLSCP